MAEYVPLPTSKLELGWTKEPSRPSVIRRAARPKTLVVFVAALLSLYVFFLSLDMLGYKAFGRPVNSYLLPGTVSVIDDGSIKVAHWEPEGRPRPPDYFREILERVSVDGTRYASARPPPVNLDFTHNRTIFLIGDSQERNVIEDFCNTLGVGGRLRIPDLYQTGDLRQDSTDAWASGRECIVPSLGLRIISVSLHGVQDDPKFWTFKQEVREPTLTWDKIRKMAFALREADINVDMILAQSGLWDLATWNIQDALASVPAAEILIEDQIIDYVKGIEHMLDQIELDFPDVPMIWRTATYTRSSPGFWFYNGLNNVNMIPRAPYASVKVNQINEAVTQVMKERHVPMLPWNYILAEQVGHFKDDIHPGGPSNS